MDYLYENIKLFTFFWQKSNVLFPSILLYGVKKVSHVLDWLQQQGTHVFDWLQQQGTHVPPIQIACQSSPQGHDIGSKGSQNYGLPARGKAEIVLIRCKVRGFALLRG